MFHRLERDYRCAQRANVIIRRLLSVARLSKLAKWEMEWRRGVACRRRRRVESSRNCRSWLLTRKQTVVNDSMAFCAEGRTLDCVAPIIFIRWNNNSASVTWATGRINRDSLVETRPTTIHGQSLLFARANCKSSAAPRPPFAIDWPCEFARQDVTWEMEKLELEILADTLFNPLSAALSNVKRAPWMAHSLRTSAPWAAYVSRRAF